MKMEKERKEANKGGGGEGRKEGLWESGGQENRSLGIGGGGVGGGGERVMVKWRKRGERGVEWKGGKRRAI